MAMLLPAIAIAMVTMLMRRTLIRIAKTAKTMIAMAIPMARTVIATLLRR
jgi:hypothetical protein